MFSLIEEIFWVNPLHLSWLLAMLPLSGLAGLQKDDEITPEKIVTSYNNFYEFGTDKSDPVNHAHEMVTDLGHYRKW